MAFEWALASAVLAKTYFKPGYLFNARKRLTFDIVAGDKIAARRGFTVDFEFRTWQKLTGRDLIKTKRLERHRDNIR